MPDPKKNTPGSSRISVSEISLPRGGGAIRGIGDSFQSNSFTGTGSFSIPIPATAARGFEPSLALEYNSGFGNGAFGVGFSLALPKISINTDKGIPGYRGKDIYLLPGAGELVKKDTDIHSEKINIESSPDDLYTIISYLPRKEGAFAKIEQWTDIATKASFGK
ncbi:MAG: SpvB/TcaC N-terminal domain-containing protein [Bacteroidota bacterium]